MNFQIYRFHSKSAFHTKPADYPTANSTNKSTTTTNHSHPLTPFNLYYNKMNSHHSNLANSQSNSQNYL